MSQIQNKLQWSENQLSEAKKIQEGLREQLNSSTEELKAQKERLNEVIASGNEANKELGDTKEKLAEITVIIKAVIKTHTHTYTPVLPASVFKKTKVFLSAFFSWSCFFVVENVF